DISRGLERLQNFLPQIEDLARDGFPYMEGARARTELQLRECIRKTFGEKSPEYQAYRLHRLSVDTPADTKQTVALIRGLIGALEDKKLELQGLKPILPAVSEPSPQSTRPQMTLVPPSTPAAHVTITPTAPAAPPPITMSVALTTNLDLSQASSAQPASPSISGGKPQEASMPSEPLGKTVTSLPVPTSSIEPRTAVGVSSFSPPPPSTAQETKPPSVPQPPRPAQVKEPVVPVMTKHETQADTPPVNVLPDIKSNSTQEKMSKAAPLSFPIEEALGDPCEIVKSLCKRFHMVARQLRLRGEYRATLDVEDEFDVQDLLHALLRLYFDDIETDEWLPSYSNGAPRTMFLLNDSRLAVSVKKTRTGLNTKDLADQLRVDVEHCRMLKRCSTLLCFVYDPEGRIGNPRGLESDLISISDQLTADVYVAPK
ncbi:MAG TPA: hypothetical protein VIU63_05705, partial [Nitrospira sp.]